MSASPFGAAPRRVELRPRPALPPLPDVHPDDADADHQDHLWAMLEEEQRRDRLDDHEGRPWPSAQVHSLPVAEAQRERRAA